MTTTKDGVQRTSLFNRISLAKAGRSRKSLDIRRGAANMLHMAIWAREFAKVMPGLPAIATLRTMDTCRHRIRNAWLGPHR